MKREDDQRQGCAIQFNRINPSYNEQVGSFAEYDLRQQVLEFGAFLITAGFFPR